MVGIGFREAFRWTAGRGMQTPSGAPVPSEAWGVGSDGKVVVGEYTSNSAQRERTNRHPDTVTRSSESVSSGPFAQPEDLAVTSRHAAIGLLALLLLLPLARAARAQCTVTNTGANLVDESLTIGNGSLGSYGLDGPGCDESYSNIIVGTGTGGDGFLDVENGATLAGSELFVGRSNGGGGGDADFRSGAQVDISGGCYVSGFFTAAAIFPPLSTLTVRDATTHLGCGTDIFVGVLGPGVMTVTDSAAVTATGLSSAHDGSAEIHVTNGGSIDFTQTNPDHTLGIREFGSLDVDGGTVTFANNTYLLTATANGGSAAIRVANGGLISLSGIQALGPTTYTIADGTIATTAGAVSTCPACPMVADGTILGDLFLQGDLDLGPGIAQLDILDNPATTGSGRLLVGNGTAFFEIAGPNSFDRIVADGASRAFGFAVEVEFIDAYVPAPGTSFGIITTPGGLIETNPITVDVMGLPPGTEVTTEVSATGVVVTVPEPWSGSWAAIAALLTLARIGKIGGVFSTTAK